MSDIGDTNYCPTCKIVVRGGTSAWREHLKAKHPELLVNEDPPRKFKDYCDKCGDLKPVSYYGGKQVGFLCDSCARSEGLRVKNDNGEQCVCGHYSGGHSKRTGSCGSCQCPKFESRDADHNSNSPLIQEEKVALGKDMFGSGKVKNDHLRPGDRVVYKGSSGTIKVVSDSGFYILLMDSGKQITVSFGADERNLHRIGGNFYEMPS